MIILASGSKSRNEQLRKLNLEFKSQAPDINEDIIENESTIALTKRLSYEKALKIAKLNPKSIVIGGDQMGECNNIPLGKPLNYENAYNQLLYLSDKSFKFYTSICVLCLEKSIKKEHTEEIEVKFNQLDRNTIENYLKMEKPYHCCASFKSEGLGIALVETIKSNDSSAIIGLPLIKLMQFLKMAGYSLL